MLSDIWGWSGGCKPRAIAGVFATFFGITGHGGPLRAAPFSAAEVAIDSEFHFSRQVGHLAAQKESHATLGARTHIQRWS
jgi:hypothetical protein